MASEKTATSFNFAKKKDSLDIITGHNEQIL